MMTRKEFLEQVMKMANLKDLKQADDAARAVISLTKLIIGPKLSQKIAKVSPPDLREGWEAIKPAYPRRPIKIITGPSGEDADLKEIVPYLQKYLGVEILIENIVGFWGKIPFEKFQELEPDGYTLISYTFPRSIIIEHIGETLFRTKEFTPIFAWSSGNQFLVVPSEGFRTFDDFLQEGKRRPLLGAIPIKGGISHLAGLLLAEGLGIQVNWVTYGGLASSMAALTRKEADFTISLAAALPSWTKAGKVRVLAMLPESSGKRSPYFQNVPTLKELGYDIPAITPRHVLEAPPNTPSHVVMVLEEALSKVIREPKYVEWTKKNCVIIDPLNAQTLFREKEETHSKIEKIKEKLREN
ncbi:MAG: tripartite tricarboxylate transporter substrate-binding protein [Thermodesulfobacteriota bacterium]